MSDIKCPYMKKECGGFFSGDTYTCTKVEHEVPYDTYNKYCTSYSYDDCPNYKYEKSSGGCYLTTITCNILGFEDKNLYLQALRKLRKDYLQKNPKTLEILKLYDFVGPIIAQRIEKDPNKKAIATEMFYGYIAPIVNKLLFEYNGSYEEVIEMYKAMTNELIKKYNLETLALTVPGMSKFDFNADYSKVGHGKKIGN